MWKQLQPGRVHHCIHGTGSTIRALISTALHNLCTCKIIQKKDDDNAFFSCSLKLSMQLHRAPQRARAEVCLCCLVPSTSRKAQRDFVV